MKPSIPDYVDWRETTFWLRIAGWLVCFFFVLGVFMGVTNAATT